MSNIIRVEHSKNYTVISNDAIRDKRISLKARGLHHLLLSYPDNWRISIEHLAEEASEKDARTAIQSALKELERFGYLAREQVRDERGRITGWENVVRELPQAGFPNMEKSTSGKHHSRKNRKRENPDVDNPPMENPAAENQYLINTDSYEVSNYEIPIPPTPQGGEEQTPALGDVGSLGASTPPLEKSEAVGSVSTDLMDESSVTREEIIAACDNKALQPKRNKVGDKHFGAVRQEQYQRSLAAKLQRTIVPIEEMEPWGSREVFTEFEAYLLEQVKSAKSWKVENPASYVAKKLQDIASGKAARTEFNEWLSKKQQPRQPQPQQSERSLLTPEQEAWVAIVSRLEQVSGFVQADIKQGSHGGWYVRTNISIPQGTVQGSLDFVIERFPLSAVQAKFPQFYAECHRLAKKKSPHLDLPEPSAQDDWAS